jgi:uncharacterized protein
VTTQTTISTQTTDGAREHARSMAGTRVLAMPTIPASSAVGLPNCVDTNLVMWDEVIAPGGYASQVVPRGSIVRLEDLQGEACAALLLHHAGHPVERLNVADTVKVQWQAYLGSGSVLLSDMGRAMATILTDDSGRHDALCGASTAALHTRKYGDGTVSGPFPNVRDQFIVALTKQGLSRRDVAPNVNLFKRVTVAPDGGLQFDRASPSGATIEIRTEMDVIITLANVPHPLDVRDSYVCTPLRLTAWADRVTDRSDQQWVSSPERERAYLNTEHFHGAER